jgi:hypothetical protein
MIRSFTVVALMCMTSGETVTAFDLEKTLKDVMPCKYAAIRLCERPQEVSAAALWKCGATLPPHHRKKSASGVWPSLNGMAQPEDTSEFW